MTAGTAAELIVYAAGVVALGADYAQAARLYHLFLFGVGLLFIHVVEVGIALSCRLLLLGEGTVGIGDCHLYHVVVVALLPHALFGEVFGVAAEQNVRAAAGHVGGDGDGAEPARLRYDLCLARVVFGVEYVVLYAVAAEQAGDLLRPVYRYGTNQDGLTVGVAVDDLLHYGLLFALHRGEDLIGIVYALNGSVCGDAHYVERVDGSELGLLGLGGTRHARQLVV